jgi:hypothetical protein
MKFSSSEELNLKKLFELLRKSKTGELLLLKANSKASSMGLTLQDVVKAGHASLTDTTLVRKFSPDSPENVVYESKSVIYINKNLRWEDAILDLAHELTHFNFRDQFNPYGDDFNPSDFITSTIEGRGGEVQAFLMECKVLSELFSRNHEHRSHCEKIQDSEGKPSHAKAVSLFYHLGNYHSKFSSTARSRGLSQIIEKIKPEKINFISSAYGVPYPVAALMEYDLVLNKVCENDKKRMTYLQQGISRAPASEIDQFSKLTKIYTSKCRTYN